MGRIKSKRRPVVGLRNPRHRINSKPTNKALGNYRKVRKRSSLELLIYDWLKELDIRFTREKTIGRCHVDIFIEPNIIVELQGCYWHGHNKCFAELNDMQKLAQLKDARRYAFFKSKGYKVFEIWECEADELPDSTKSKLKEIYENRNK